MVVTITLIPILVVLTVFFVFLTIFALLFILPYRGMQLDWLPLTLRLPFPYGV